ncbi:MAG: Glu/Leu/Phe/Val dehydrogenase dimerization domain-containing protein [Saprospiraceae bacterium]|nr:Glu/Leu/Phe/Val dehydrogenase dimerization domain-containing protein [Saprospiraceae bacterium]
MSLAMYHHPEFDHENVHHFNDPATGLQCIIAIHRTVAGTTGGGCRFFPYASPDDALTDVLRLSRAMTYKNVLAGLPMGGGKAVVIGNPDTDKSPEILAAFARCVESLGGRYVTACDVGTNEDDMRLVHGHTRYTMGAKGHGGSTAPLTGYGVYQSMRAAWESVTGSTDLAGVRVAVQGYGGVGTYLVKHLLEAGADLVVADPHPAAAQRARSAGLAMVPVDEILFRETEILSPNALGAVLNDLTIPKIKARLICGGANNQLEEARHADALMDQGIVFIPDFVASAGGIIHGEGHYRGRSKEEILKTVERIYDTTREVLKGASARNQTPLVAAYELAEQRLQEHPA